MAQYTDYIAVVEYGHTFKRDSDVINWSGRIDLFTLDHVNDALTEYGYTRGTDDRVWVRVNGAGHIPAVSYARVYFKELNA